MKAILFMINKSWYYILVDCHYERDTLSLKLLTVHLQLQTRLFYDLLHGVVKSCRCTKQKTDVNLLCFAMLVGFLLFTQCVYIGRPLDFSL